MCTIPLSRTARAGSVLSYSCDPGKVSYDAPSAGGRNGAFTTALLRHLTAEAAHVDSVFIRTTADVIAPPPTSSAPGTRTASRTSTSASTEHPRQGRAVRGVSMLADRPMPAGGQQTDGRIDAGVEAPRAGCLAWRAGSTRGGVLQRSAWRRVAPLRLLVY